MRLLVVSDLHLEFGPFEFPTPMPEFDVAVFAGDMGKPIAGAVAWMVLQEQLGPLYGRPVVYVPGNHEFYGSEMKSCLAEGREAAEIAGIELLARRSVVINGVRFIGCILWTDYRLLGTPKPSMVVAGHELNDHRLIRYREESGHYSRFMPWHAVAEHR
jgi:predicted phosphodiesterase